MWLGWRGAQWLALCGALAVLVALAEAFLGHYRSGFAVRMQYSPFVVGLGLIVAFIGAIAGPNAPWVPPLLRSAALIAIALSVIGVAYHWYYGVIEKPGGFRGGWLLHHLMYHAPLLAPLALAFAGVLAAIVSASLVGRPVLGGIGPSRATAMSVIGAAAGLMLQVAVLHYRGAFKNPVMYAPIV